MTYSIVAIDKATGTTGVATITGSIAVGAFVPHCKAGVGAIATQGDRTNWLYGEKGLELLSRGHNAQQALDSLTLNDAGLEHRQCAIVDGKGNLATWTGRFCENISEHCQSSSAVAIGNLLASNGITAAMVSAFEETGESPMAERLLRALEAGYAQGGDSRGLISGAICVDSFFQAPINLRIDSAPNRVLESLRYLLEQYQSGDFKHFFDALPTRDNYGKYKSDTE